MSLKVRRTTDPHIHCSFCPAIAKQLPGDSLSKSMFIKVIQGLYRGYLGIMEEKMEATILGSASRVVPKIRVPCWYP